MYSQDDINTWIQKGDKEYAVFKEEQENEMLSAALGEQKFDEERRNNALLNLYGYYVYADYLAQIEEERGSGANLYITYISEILREVRPFFINAGVYYNERKDFMKASQAFEIYSSYPKLSIFNDERVAPLAEDENEPVIKYYAIVCAIQSGDTLKTIELLKLLISEPYIPNETYKESDPYELLANEYSQMGNSEAFKEVLMNGAEKFPHNNYFLHNLINEYFRTEEYDKAMAYLEKAIAQSPENKCELLSVKASMLVYLKKMTESEAIYLQALKADKNCSKALEGIGVLYILQAQDIKEKSEYESDKKKKKKIDKEAIYYYKKSLPYLQQYYALLKKEDTDTMDKRMILTKLQNVYYNLELLGVDKKKDLENTELELDKL